MRTTITLVCVAAISGIVYAAHPTVDPGSPGVRRQLGQTKMATARFHDIRIAEMEGYSNSGLPCVEGMGYHWRKPSLIGTALIDQPPVLVYYPRTDGFLQLVAVEWVSPFDVSNPPPPQELFGQQFHLPTWPGGPVDRYVLHAWVWLHNEDGMFDDTNPKLRCPED